MAKDGTVWRAMPCLMLVVLTAFGVAAMHTFGHPAHTGYSHPMVAAVDDSVAAADPDPAHLAIQMVVTATQVGTSATGCGCMLDGCDPTAVCLAVLTAASPQHAVRWSLTPHGPSAADEWLSYAWGVGSGPPPLPVRLRLAELSVLRR